MDKKIEWAQNQLKAEIDSKFARGSTLTWPISRFCISAFLSLTANEQNRLVLILPTGVRFSTPSSRVSLKSLCQNDQNLIEHLNEVIAQRLDPTTGEGREWASRSAPKALQPTARIIAREMIRHLKRGLKRKGFEISNLEPLVLWARNGFGETEFTLELDALWPFVLRYSIFKEIPVELQSGRVAPIPGERFAYLESLGLGPSGWACMAMSDVLGVVDEAIVFCEWHLAQIKDI